jgi:signal transduction histidine kinase
MNRQTFLFWTGVALTGALMLCTIYLRTISSGHQTELSVENPQTIVSEQLEKAASLFESELQNFEQKNEALLGIFQNNIIQEASGSAVYNQISESDFWGITVLKNGDKWVWKDFDISNLPEIQTRPAGLSVAALNNTTLLLNTETLLLGEDIYTIYSAVLLEQPSDLPIEPVKNSILNRINLNLSQPVTFHFFEQLPDSTLQQPLIHSESDTLGVISVSNAAITTENGFTTNQSHHILFTVEALLLLTLLSTLFLWISNSKSVFSSLIYLCIVGIGWIFLALSDIHMSRAEFLSGFFPGYDSIQIGALFNYIIHSVFIVYFFGGLQCLASLLRKPSSSEKHFRMFGLSLLYGAFSAVIIVFAVYSTLDLLTVSKIPLIELQLSPGLLPFIYYLSSLLFFSGALGLIIVLGYTLNISEADKLTILSLLSATGFVLAYYLIDLYTEKALFEAAIFGASVFFFIISLFIINMLQTHGEKFESMSGFRKMLLLIIIISVGSYSLIWNSYQKNLDQNLYSQVITYLSQGGPSSSQILYNVLAETESDLKSLTSFDIMNRRQPVSNRFQRAVQANVDSTREEYSFYLKMITPAGSEITSYSTSIATPAWGPFFNSDIMMRSYRGQQLRWQTNQPVIWGRPVNISDIYTNFERGWIPLYDSSDPTSIIAWIVGDIFKERLDYNKPIRAVLSDKSIQKNRNSIYISEYVGNRLTNSALYGIYYNQPHYHKLPEAEANILADDAVRFFINRTSDQSFRVLLVRHSDRNVVKASAPLPGLNLHIFSLFKLQIVMIFFGLFCFAILAGMGFPRFSLFGQSNRFSAKLIDGLALSTILLLTVLILATQFTLYQQNERDIRRELTNDLNGLSESLKERSEFLFDEVTTEVLSEITMPLNIDLMLFRGSELEVSTTPQIFQQNILPATMPYRVYRSLYENELALTFSSTTINNEKLIIGYRSILNADGRPVGAVAIPTFLESPVFVEQMLQTTSYLLLVYLVMFTLFIGGTVFLSGRLTRPLTLIQRGLNKITKGDTESKVPVSGNDEIGSLAAAYNEMVERLDDAQKELIKAERESAWKEMAQQVAHEIKNPLTPMKLNLQHLQRQLESNPDDVLKLKPLIEKTADNIISQIESLNKIASDFSKFAKPVQTEKHELNLNEIIHSAISLYEHNDSVTIKKTVTNQQIYINGDEDELRRVFINLIKNGIEAVKDRPSEIHVRLYKSGGIITAEVQDNGEGIAKEDREQIFSPQFSTKSSGTGLGLAITKKIVEAHNGTISFESEPGEGTTFILRFKTG